MYKAKVLAIDDDITFLESIKKVLEFENYYVETIAASSEVENVLKGNGYDVVLLDVKMPGVNGLDLLETIENIAIGVPVIVISGQSTIATAVEAIKFGAFDFIEKPIDAKRLNVALTNAIRHKNLLDEKKSLLNELEESHKIVGVSSVMQRIINDIKTIAPTNAKVLITGESGTGKELAAWAIHYYSNRRNKPYLRINCAAIPSELLESQLFGHKKGSFTGASNDHTGKFEAANGGTLFLDEIGDLEIGLQAKILRAIEEGEIEQIGSNDSKQLDVRFIAATNQDLAKKVEEGKFRADLFHRLNVVQIYLPPLRERKDDIVPLAHHFLQKFNDEYNKRITDISAQAAGILKQYDWFGNVRQLKSVIENIVIFSSNERIEISDVLEAFSRLQISHNAENSADNTPYSNTNLREARERFEKEFILNILKDNEWSIGETAERLGVDRTNLFKKMRKYGIQKPEKEA